MRVGTGGEADLLGVAFALGAAVCWAAYILLTQRVGDEVEGLAGLAISMPVAAVVATLVAVPGGVVGDLTPELLLLGLGLAILLPVVPFALELLARGTWSGAGVLGPEAFDAVPFLDLLTEYGSPWGQQEL